MSEHNLNALKEMLVEMDDCRKAVADGEDWETYLVKRLADTDEAIGYLKAAMEQKDLELFLLALRHVMEAQDTDELNFTPADYHKFIKILRAALVVTEDKDDER